MMQPDYWNLYRMMLESRLFEEEVIRLWNEGQISGEMHMGLGEEAVVAGVVDHLKEGDAMALDHRGTPPLIMRGVDPVLLLREFLGHPQGLCRGMGGHMHLFSKQHLSASSGIVGASGPAAAGFGLAAQILRPGSVSVAFFGEGAMNQGMLLESMNLAAVWKLPVIFVCKDNQWAISTLSPSVTKGFLADRAMGLGLYAIDVNGLDAGEMWNAANEVIGNARSGGGPAFIHAYCTHLEGHFLGDPLLELSRHPIAEMGQMAGPLLKSITHIKGSALKKRVESLGSITSLIGKTARQNLSRDRDPVKRLRNTLCGQRSKLEEIESKVKEKIRKAVREAASG